MNNKVTVAIKVIKRTLLFFIVFQFIFTACIPQEKLQLLQYKNINDSSYSNQFLGDPDILTEYLIQPNDYLYINIMTIEKELSDFLQPGAGMNYLNSGNQALIGYNVDNNGNIFFPYLGSIPVGGLTIQQVHDTIKASASQILGPRIRIEVKLINNTINIMGEVNKEGIYNMTKSKITIYEALTLSGGLTNFAKRQEIKVLRTTNGVKTLYQVDVTSGMLIENGMFYVYPNDVIYVDAMKAKSFGLTPTFSLTLISSLMSTTLTFLLLISTINAN